MNSVTSYKSNSVEIPDWNYFVSELQALFNLSDTETEKIYGGKTARIIAAIPFAAECENPERTAILHLCAYVAELRGFQKYCSHLPSDDKSLYERLEMIAHFTGGNRNVIEHGMDMLALIMLRGYSRSRKKDAEDGTYNPLNSGAWDFDAAEKILEARIKNFSNVMLDGIFYGPSLGDSIW